MPGDFIPFKTPSHFPSCFLFYRGLFSSVLIPNCLGTFLETGPLWISVVSTFTFVTVYLVAQRG